MGPLTFLGPIGRRRMEKPRRREQRKCSPGITGGWQDRSDVVIAQSRGVRSTGTPPARVSKPLSLWWLAAYGAGFPACISAQSAERWSIPVRLGYHRPRAPEDPAVPA